MAYFNRGFRYLSKKDYDRAIGDFSEAIRPNPSHAGAFRMRGDAYFDKGDYGRAIADYNEVIRLAHRNGEQAIEAEKRRIEAIKRQKS